jgi:hypothetical protein
VAPAPLISAAMLGDVPPASVLRLLLCPLWWSALAAAAAPLPPAGHVAAWLYDDQPPKHPPASFPVAIWSDALAAFNHEATKPINVAYSYGGDMEWWGGANTYFPDTAVKAAAAYKTSTAGVKYVVAVIDGRMDGGKNYSPDLSRFTRAQVEAWANLTAQVVCASEHVDGVQIDLEPVEKPYVVRLTQFLARLSEELRSPGRGCVSSSHPKGRSLSAFMFAAAATADMWAALGPNGYVTVSGYDLSSEPPGVASSVEEYGARLGAVVDTIIASAKKHDGSFVLGIPAAASCHEFEMCHLRF